MLSEIKDRATGWMAWVIVIIISIPFAFWGVNEYLSARANVPVAEVAGHEISQEDYRQNLQQVRERFRRSGLNSDYLDSKEFKRKVVDSMVTSALLDLDADEQGYRIGDVQLSEFIRTVPEFQRDGKFDQDAYQRALIASGQNAVGFEQRMRRENVLAQIRNSFSESAFITPSERIELLGLYTQKRDYDYALVRPSKFENTVSLSEQEIEQRYNDNRDRYQTPEQIKIQFLKLAVSDFAKEVAVNDEQIEKYYQENINRYLTPETRAASHILIKLAKDADDKARNAALEKAQALVQQARDGADFAELAKNNSADTVSAKNGGDLGIVKQGQMVPAFEQALFALAKEGDVSEPVLSDFGYHVIKLNSIIAEKPKPLEEVKAKIKQDLQRALAEEQFIAKSEAFNNAVYEQSHSLEPAAEATGLEIQTSDWFTRDKGTGIAANPKVREVAFSAEVLNEERNSESFELDQSTLISLRKLEYKKARPQELKEVRDDIEKTLRQEKARAKAKQAGEDLLKKLKGGEAWDSLLSAEALTGETASHQRSENVSQPPAQVVEAAFQLPKPGSTGASYAGLALDNGVFYLVRLRQVVDGDVENASAEVKQKIDALLKARRGREYYYNYEAGLRKRAEAGNSIKVFEENL